MLKKRILLIIVGIISPESRKSLVTFLSSYFLLSLTLSYQAIKKTIMTKLLSRTVAYHKMSIKLPRHLFTVNLQRTTFKPTQRAVAIVRCLYSHQADYVKLLRHFFKAIRRTITVSLWQDVASIILQTMIFFYSKQDISRALK